VLHWYLRAVVRARLGAGSEVLEVGGSRVSVQSSISEDCIGRSRYTVIDTRSLDYHATIAPPHRFVLMDVSRMDFANDTFDVILCNHTLPYVRDDRAAMGEIYRTLKPDGLAMLEVPRDAERTVPVDAYRRAHPELGDEYFAENGDQWVYGEDYPERLEMAGFAVRIDTLFADCDDAFKREHGLKAQSELIVGFKSPAGAARFPPPESGPNV
jgi:ubiquinone/menaquinone biosynthesis C-methylase UbiE